MSIAYRLSILALLSLRGMAQTVSPLVVVSDTVPYCEDRSIRFTILQVQDFHAFSWSVTPAKEITTSYSADSSEITITFGIPMTHSVSVTALDTDDVTHSGRKVVSISRNALAAFNASLLTQGFPNALYLTNFSSNYLNLTWRFNDGSTFTDPDIVREYTSSGSFSVELFAKGAGG